MFTKNLIFLCFLICEEWMVIYMFWRSFIKTPKLYLANTSQCFTDAGTNYQGGFPGSSDGKESTYSAGDLGSVLGLVRLPRRRA